MSVSTSNLAKELKGLLGAGTNGEVLARVRELAGQPEPRPEALVVAVAWRPGDEHAGVVVLAGGDVAVGLLAEALRRGQAALLQQMERTAMQAREEATQLRRRLEEGG